MASNMKYCHICKAMAFVKTQLSTVVTLDCGHMAKLKGDDAVPERKSKEDIQRERAAVRRYIPPPTLTPNVAATRPTSRTRVVVEESQPPYCEGCATYSDGKRIFPMAQHVCGLPNTPPAPTRPHRKTNDVTKTLKDLIDGKDYK